MDRYFCINCKSEHEEWDVFTCQSCQVEMDSQSHDAHNAYCHVCVGNHVEKEHEIVNFKGEKPAICKEHNRVVRFYCNDCQQVVCDKCSFCSAHNLIVVKNLSEKTIDSVYDMVHIINSSDQSFNYKKNAEKLREDFLREQELLFSNIWSNLEWVFAQITARFESERAANLSIIQELDVEQGTVEHAMKNIKYSALYDMLQLPEDERALMSKKAQNAMNDVIGQLGSVTDQSHFLNPSKVEKGLLSGSCRRFVEEICCSVSFPKVFKLQKEYFDDGTDIILSPELAKTDERTLVIGIGTDSKNIVEVSVTKNGFRLLSWEFDHYSRLWAKVGDISLMVESSSEKTDSFRQISTYAFYLRFNSNSYVLNLDKKTLEIVDEKIYNDESFLCHAGEMGDAIYNEASQTIHFTEHNFEMQANLSLSPRNFKVFFNGFLDFHIIKDNKDILYVNYYGREMFEISYLVHRLESIDFVDNVSRGEDDFVLIWSFTVKIVQILKRNKDGTFKVVKVYEWKSSSGIQTLTYRSMDIGSYMVFQVRRKFWDEKVLDFVARDVPVVLTCADENNNQPPQRLLLKEPRAPNHRAAQYFM